MRMTKRPTTDTKRQRRYFSATKEKDITSAEVVVRTDEQLFPEV